MRIYETEDDYMSGCIPSSRKPKTMTNIPTVSKTTTYHNGATHTQIRTEHKLVIRGAHQSSMNRWGVFAVPRGESGRQVDGGPLVPGPWAGLFQLAGVIDNHGGSAAESARDRAAGLEHPVAAGDVVVIDGCSYTVRVDRCGYASLEAA